MPMSNRVVCHRPIRQMHGRGKRSRLAAVRRMIGVPRAQGEFRIQEIVFQFFTQASHNGTVGKERRVDGHRTRVLHPDLIQIKINPKWQRYNNA